MCYHVYIHTCIHIFSFFYSYVGNLGSSQFMWPVHLQEIKSHFPLDSGSSFLILFTGTQPGILPLIFENPLCSNTGKRTAPLRSFLFKQKRTQNKDNNSKSLYLKQVVRHSTIRQYHNRIWQPMWANCQCDSLRKKKTQILMFLTLHRGGAVLSFDN